MSTQVSKQETASRTGDTAEAVSKYTLLRLNSSGAWALNLAGERPQAVAQSDDAISKPINPHLLDNKPGTHLMIASAAITAYAEVYPAAAGKISSTPSGPRIGIALTTASGDGSHIEVLVTDHGRRGLLFSNTTQSAAIGASSTAEADFDQTYSVPAGFLKAGDVVRIRAMGEISGINGTPQGDIRVYFGTEVVAQVTVAAGAANDNFYVDGEFILRAVGSAGTIEGGGLEIFDAEGTAPVTFVKDQATEATDVAVVVKVSGQFDASHASNTMVLEHLSVELV